MNTYTPIVRQRDPCHSTPQAFVLVLVLVLFVVAALNERGISVSSSRLLTRFSLFPCFSILSAVQFLTGDVFEGDFRHGVQHGSGILREANGAVYDGAFRNGEVDGHGTYKSADGASYTVKKKKERKGNEKGKRNKEERRRKGKKKREEEKEEDKKKERKKGRKR